MRWFAATALALAIARGAQADPAAPQVNPQPARHEDAQRLREQLRGLDGSAVAPSPADAAAAASTAPPSAPTQPDVTGHPGYRNAGIALLAVGGGAALTTITLFATTPSDPDAAAGYDGPKLGFALIAVTCTVTGVLMFNYSRSVQVAPTVTAGGAGLAISGRM
jgi:hypothetical protein